MKIFHISDLHIGKQLHYYNLADDQFYILRQIVEKAKEYRPDVILIAGDIYDKAVPSGEAYEIFDLFLNDLAAINPVIPVLIIAGNHDNAMRLKYASSFLEKQHIYISAFPPQRENEFLRKIVLEDEYGGVNFYLLPFTKPAYVRGLFEESGKPEMVRDYNSAIRALLEREHIDFSKRNVLLAHQFFVADGSEPQRSDSELAYISVGGIDSVDICSVEQFDYAALGHIHGAQSIGKPYIRYSGAPFKYSVSEERHRKGITFVTLKEKGSRLQFETIPFLFKRDVRSIKGTLKEVIAEASDENREDYVSITLTDEDSLYRPKDQLREHYQNILEVRIENNRTRGGFHEMPEAAHTLDPLSAFCEFYQLMNDQPISDAERKVMEEIINGAAGRMEDLGETDIH